ncbi:hypothetical protein ACFS2C_01390 [Prauserella oleivorans]|uniref:Uncharacterized protein n=1 Tax=Prauserella oleivorans TaxID=1478153 RepID=A0ABW5W3F5_9PSEU
MTRDSDGGRPQKTVAELLAEHGGQVGGAPRRRRRRAADDDDAPGGRQPSISDTAPQAIIDRVRAEGPPPPGVGRRNGAAPAPPRGDRPDEGSALPSRGTPQQGSGGFPVPPPDEGDRPPLPPRARNGAAPTGMPPADPQGRMSSTRRVPPATPPAEPPRPEGSLAARLEGAEQSEAPEQQPPAPGQPPQTSGAFPMPPRRRRPPRGAPPPPPEPNTEQFPAVVDEQAEQPTTLNKAVDPDEPPAGLANWRRRRRETLPEEDTEVGITPVAPPAETSSDADEGPATGFFVPDFDDDDDDASPYGGGVLDDDPLAESGRDADYPDYADDDYDERAGTGEDYDRRDDADEDVDDTSPAKQWLALAGQLALGVVGGAAVWLGFNWLWGVLPAAALVAALLVTVALVWIVRKVRRADDLQTTVLALLVGLVVTVSPAALLLVTK